MKNFGPNVGPFAAGFNQMDSQPLGISLIYTAQVNAITAHQSLLYFKYLIYI